MSSAPDHHAGDPDLHHAWNDYFWPCLLVGNDERRGCSPSRWACSGRRPRRQPGLGRADGRGLVAALPILILFVVFAKKDRQLDRLLRHQVSHPSPDQQPRSPRRGDNAKGPTNDGKNAQEIGSRAAGAAALA